ncbi:hypothetical protein ACFL5B_02510 [Candidatus Latescibacterota bacterium]
MALNVWRDYGISIVKTEISTLFLEVEDNLKLPNSNDISHSLRFIPILVIWLVIFPEKVFEAEYQVKYKTEKIVLCDSLKVDVTWYTSSIRETDSTPFITADGSRVRDGIIAVSKNLLEYFDFRDSLFVEDLGWFEIRDCMHQRWMNAVDIWCYDRDYALQNG